MNFLKCIFGTNFAGSGTDSDVREDFPTLHARRSPRAGKGRYAIYVTWQCKNV